MSGLSSPPNDRAATRISIERDLWSNEWIAYLDGKSSPILQPSSGNLRPARRWTWPTPDDAEADLRAFFDGFPVEFTRKDAP